MQFDDNEDVEFENAEIAIETGNLALTVVNDSKDKKDDSLLATQTVENIENILENQLFVEKTRNDSLLESNRTLLSQNMLRVSV